MMNRQGMSLLELLTSTVIFALATLVILSSLRGFFRAQDEIVRLTDLTETSTALSAQILEVGRIALDCAKGGSGELLCNVSFAVPPSPAALTPVRFRLAGSELLFEESKGGGVWKVRRKFPNIIKFDICDDTDMSTVAGCKITPTAISTTHEQTRTVGGMFATPNSSFFRFQFTQSMEKTPSANGPTVSFQGAFYVRSSMSIPGVGRFLYQWGSGR